MRRIYIFGAVVIMVILCVIVSYGYFVDRSQDRVDIRGTVKNVTIYGNAATILVEGQKENDTSYDKASVRIDQHTLITMGVTSRDVDVGVIQVGDKVEVTFTGPVAESYPVQALAELINIIEEVE